MADASTTLYGLIKPEVGASSDTWGSKLNADLDDADALLGAFVLTGSSSAYVLTTGLSLAAYASKQRFLVQWNHTNASTSPTLNVDTLGAKNIKKRDGSTSPSASDLVSGWWNEVLYDGTNIVVLDLLPSDFQPPDATLTALAALSYTSGTLYITMTGADTFALVDDATLVKTSGAQTIAGTKTFTGLLYSRTAFASIGVLSTNDASGIGMRFANSGATADLVYLQATSNSFSPVLNVATLTPSTGVWDWWVPPTVGGVAARVAGKTAVPIPASAMVPNTTNGAAAGTTETTTNKVMYRTLDFDTTTQESAQFLIPMPKGWNESTVTFQACWTAASGSGGVAWDLAGVAFSDDDALDTAFGTAQQVTDTLLSAGDAHWTSESSAITIAGSPAANDLVIFRVRRVPADASDTLGVDAKLIAIRLFITTDAANDA